MSAFQPTPEQAARDRFYELVPYWRAVDDAGMPYSSLPHQGGRPMTEPEYLAEVARAADALLKALTAGEWAGPA